MGYTNTRATMKWWDPQTKKLKYFSSVKFDEYSNKVSSHIISPSQMIYLKSMPIFHQEALQVAL